MRGFDCAGDIASIDYSDSTPDVTFTYDRLGRTVQVSQAGASASSLAYDILGNFLGERFTAGPLSGFTVTNIHDSLLRRVTNGIWNGSAWVTLLTNAYDFAGRFSLVSDRTNAAGYTYVSKSPLISQIQFTNAGQLRVTETRTYDFLNRLTKIESVNAQPATLASFAYAYNSANQRTSITNLDNSRWDYSYDTLGQVTSGKRAWADGSAMAGQQFEYGYDDIGNRKFAASGGDQWGANLRYQNYTANLLNQYAQRTVPGSINVIGAANSNSTVTVNLQPTTRKSEYFRSEVSADNSAAALWLTLTNVGVLPNGTNADIVTTNAGYAFVPKTPEVFSYDADGNLTNDGRFFYTWDGENRLTKVESQTSAPTASKRRLALEYTGQSRLVRLTEYNGSSGSYVVIFVLADCRRNMCLYRTKMSLKRARFQASAAFFSPVSCPEPVSVRAILKCRHPQSGKLYNRGDPLGIHPHNCRSSERYWIASEM